MAYTVTCRCILDTACLQMHILQLTGQLFMTTYLTVCDSIFPSFIPLPTTPLHLPVIQPFSQHLPLNPNIYPFLQITCCSHPLDHLHINCSAVCLWKTPIKQHNAQTLTFSLGAFMLSLISRGYSNHSSLILPSIHLKSSCCPLQTPASDISISRRRICLRDIQTDRDMCFKTNTWASLLKGMSKSFSLFPWKSFHSFIHHSGLWHVC